MQLLKENLCLEKGRLTEAITKREVQKKKNVAPAQNKSSQGQEYDEVHRITNENNKVEEQLTPILPNSLSSANAGTIFSIILIDTSNTEANELLYSS